MMSLPAVTPSSALMTSALSVPSMGMVASFRCWRQSLARTAHRPSRNARTVHWWFGCRARFAGGLPIGLETAAAVRGAPRRARQNANGPPARRKAVRSHQRAGPRLTRAIAGSHHEEVQVGHAQPRAHARELNGRCRAVSVAVVGERAGGTVVDDEVIAIL